MRKLLIALLFLTFVATACFAQPTQKTESQPVVAKQVEDKTFVGKVEMVAVADVIKGTKSEIALVDEAGKKLVLFVKSTTTIYDASSVSITLDKIKKDEKVKAKYQTTKEGIEEAISIHVML